MVNGSPIVDTMPLLIALRAGVMLMSLRGARELPLESLYTGYRSNVMATDEVLVKLVIPRPQAHEFLRVYKVSKRLEDDISAVCLAVQLHLIDGVVIQAAIGVGGVAATPVRARQTEAVLQGQVWSQALLAQAMATLRQEFQPISDMRATSGYRTKVLGNLLQRLWLESQGDTTPHLAGLTLEELSA